MKKERNAFKAGLFIVVSIALIAGASAPFFTSMVLPP